MQCRESLRVQAFVDGEMDALSGAEIERHLGHCGECRELRSHLESLRGAIRTLASNEPAPPELRQRVLAALDAEDAARVPDRPRVPRRSSTWSFWTGAVSGLAAAAAAVLIALYVVMPARVNPVVDEVLGAHVGALMSGHLMEVVSTDHHTVKPWFAGHTEVSPVVVDFAAQGYALAGGRVDYLEHQRAAVLVYRHGLHVIDVYCWAAPAGALPGNVTRKGYHLAFWKSGDLAYAAVSDTGWDELLAMVGLLRKAE